MRKTISMIETFRALTHLVENLAKEINSENLGVLAFEMQPSASGSPSSDPALFDVWRRLWGDGEKEPADAAAVSRIFIEHESDWGYNDDGPARLEQFLRLAQHNQDSLEYREWVRDLLRAAPDCNI